ncbi:DUF4307 domain-containing protein [Sediminivirga luteola]|uniref:DUF4307 domain-containing protein n=1 Tax=Sediminivirga luteola TaxID=1774748 RepID=A0A8J2TWW0_9MICO|nr:DUF4307 domain-containing protein [Sediminivirga luteola]GGA09472.1 hypothetical protein GCM10011333_10300 [Sediminivirga luteola]
MSTHAPADLQASRYGRKSSGRRGIRYGIPAALAAVAVGVAAWWAFAPSDSPGTPQIIRYSALDAAHASALVEIAPDRQRDTVCGFIARSNFQADVGYYEVRVPATEAAAPQRHEIVIRTIEPPTAVVADECWFE